MLENIRKSANMFADIYFSSSVDSSVDFICVHPKTFLLHGICAEVCIFITSEMGYLSLGLMGFMVGLSGAILPGPLLAYTISKAIEGKARNAMVIVTGHILIEAVMIILLLLGLKQMVGSKSVHFVLSILGGGVIILMGLNTFLKANERSLTVNNKPDLYPGLIIGGVFFTAFNPTFPAWWVSVGAALLFRALLLGSFGVVLLVLGHWLADLIWYSLVGLAVSRGKLWLNDKRYQLVLKVLGLALIILGALFIWQLKLAEGSGSFRVFRPLI